MCPDEPIPPPPPPPGPPPKIVLPASDDELLAQCEMEMFRSGGKGGQNVNKVSSAVRLRHLPSGIVVSSQRERSQYQNRMICLELIREKAAKLNYRKPKRVPTKEPRSVKAKVLKGKKRTGAKKQMRRKPADEE